MLLQAWGVRENQSRRSNGKKVEISLHTGPLVVVVIITSLSRRRREIAMGLAPSGTTSRRVGLLNELLNLRAATLFRCAAPGWVLYTAIRCAISTTLDWEGTLRSALASGHIGSISAQQLYYSTHQVRSLSFPIIHKVPYRN